MAGCAGKPDSTGLRDSRGTARTVDRKRDRVAACQFAAQLDERPAAAARRRPSRRPVTETAYDTGDPLAVEVCTGDDDNAAIAPVKRGRKDPAVPEGEYRRPACAHQIVEVMSAFDTPRERARERGGKWICRGSNRASLQKLRL